MKSLCTVAFLLAFGVSCVLSASLDHHIETNTTSSTDGDDIKTELMKIQLSLQGFKNLVQEKLMVLHTEIRAVAAQNQQCCKTTQESCEKVSTYLQTNKVSEKSTCKDPGYTQFKGSSYKIVNDKVNWQTAMGRCHLEGGHLVAIPSKEEGDFIQSLIAHTVGNGGFVQNELWTGGHDINKEGQFIWESTGKNVSYTNWQLNEPNNSANEDCIELFADTGAWNDEGCGAKNGYVCEKTVN